MGLFSRKKHEDAETAPAVPEERPAPEPEAPYVVDVLYADDPGIESTSGIERIYRPPMEGDYEAELAQSLRFPEARGRVRASRNVVRVTATAFADDSPRERYERVVAIVGGLVARSEPTAVVSRATGEVLDPRRVAETPIELTVNVRRLPSPSGEGATLMDTTGLTLLGVPDLQCHFRGIDPDALETYMYGIAEYLLDDGDFVRDGQALQGIDFHDRWKVKHQTSLAEPHRRVIDLNPGRHHAVGS
jgi:hypothetical protein